MSRIATFWSIALLAVVGCLVYANTLNVPFHFDDEVNIQHEALKLEALDKEQVLRALGGGALVARPVSNFSFALNYFIGENRVQGYHLVNIFIHVCAGIFLFLLLRATLTLAPNRDRYPRAMAIALMAALIWAVHPLGTQSVTYIVQRMNSMAAMFFVLALLLYVKGRQRQLAAERRQSALPAWAWFLASAVAGLLAVGSKEIAATLPFFIFLYEWYFFQDLRWTWLRGKLLWLAGVLTAILGLAFAYTNGMLLDKILNSCSNRDFTILERVLTQFRVIIHYLTLLIYPNPDRLALDYDFPVSTSLLSPLTTLYSLLGLLALLVLAVLLARRERLLSFCMLWFFGNLLIESSVICLEIIFEHRTYLPSMFLILLVVALAYRISNNHRLVALPLALLIALLACWTWERNKVWQTSETLWTDSVRKHHGKARPYVNLGNALMEIGKLAEAEKAFKRSLVIDPEAQIAHSNLAGLLFRQGREEEAGVHYQEAVRLKPDFVAARVGFGTYLRKRGEYQAAVEQFRAALSVTPGNTTVNKNLGNALLRAGNPKEALQYLQKAADGAPRDKEILIDIGESLTLLGRLDEAVESYRSVLDQNWNEGQAHYHLGLLLKQKKLEKEALLHYREADRLLRYPAELKYDYANLLFRTGHLSEADQAYRDFLAIGPTVSMAMNNRGLVLISQGHLLQAAGQFEMALRVTPENQMAANNLRLVREQLQAVGAGNEQEGTPQP